ncbi:putative copper resistance protein D [Kribbella aluminosa]|uniref:Copper resistance protein D n=1 Tax=Kribbella aluminosa TaxID=416017 RepID=A0ABS4UNF0_9ACTN|nr:cytochrome c oxidase assembly protein [Kribbella aluminosa]MBP2353165.1 putative copper resistance protein D [Kribbella aluminosa]
MAPTRHRPWLIRYVVLLGVLAVAVPLVTTGVMGPDSYLPIARDDPGRATGLITTFVRAVADLSSLVTVGALASALFAGKVRPVQDKASRRQLEVAEWFEPVVVRRAATAWVISSGLLIALDSADSNGYSLGKLADPQALWFALFSGDAGRSWMVTFATAVVVLVTCVLSVRWIGYAVALGAALAGSLAPVVVGQILVGPRHDFGSDAGILQTVAGQVLLGMIVVQALRVVTGRRVRALDRVHWRSTAAVLFGVLVVTEGILLWFKLAGSSPFASATGWLSLGQFVALGVVGAGLAAVHRGRITGAAVLLASGTAGFVAAGLAMTRIPPPQFFVPTSISQIFFGFDVKVPPGLGALAGQWRPNLLFVTAAVVAVAGYLVGVRRLARRGERWPVARTIAWTLGWVVIVVVTSSGLGKYSGADFAVHMAVHMALSMLAPIPLVLGGPITLALRALPAATKDADKDAQPGPHEWVLAFLHSRPLQALYHPLFVFTVYIGSYYALYLTNAFGTLMKFHWAHQLMNLHFLVVGCLYFGLVIGVDRTPHQMPSLAKLAVLLGAMPFHAFFGVILMSDGAIIGKSFYDHLELPWTRDLAATQHVAGGIAWAGSEIPLLIVVVVLALQWAVQDGRAARRIDRHLDSGLDHSYDAYNAMLQRLARRTESTQERR